MAISAMNMGALSSLGDSLDVLWTCTPPTTFVIASWGLFWCLFFVNFSLLLFLIVFGNRRPYKHVMAALGGRDFSVRSD